MTDPIRAALERAARELELVACAAAQAGFDASACRARNEAHAARAALSAAPPEPVGEGLTDEELERAYQSAYQPAWERGEFHGAHFDGLRAAIAADRQRRDQLNAITGERQ